MLKFIIFYEFVLKVVITVISCYWTKITKAVFAQAYYLSNYWKIGQKCVIDYKKRLTTLHKPV